MGRSAVALGGLALLRRFQASAAEAARADGALRVALLSDTHIAADPASEYRKFRPAENLRTALTEVMALRPDHALINGDVARLTGEPADYEAVKAHLAPLVERTPVSLVLGNHDHRENLLKAFSNPAATATPPVKGRHVLVLEWPMVRFVLLDSLLAVNVTPGQLGSAQRQWLAGFLEKADARPTVIFIHHTLGDADMDLTDSDRLFALLRPHRQVKAIFYGHSHEYSFQRHQGIDLVNLPALGYNFADREPVGWVEARFTARGVDLTLRALGGNRAGHGQTRELTWGV